ncbi:MAG: alpha/beta hydrolase [Asticcacaulis sp.]
MTLTKTLRRAGVAAAAVMALAFATAPVHAQEDKMVPIPTPAQTDAIVLGTGPLPGATAKESWHHQYNKDFARNVTIATLTPYLPDPAKATGAAVIVAPGGGFMTLSMENEGSDVAKALAAKGVAAFVLKYRLHQTPESMDAFDASMKQMFAGVAARPPAPPAGAPPAGAAPAGGPPGMGDPATYLAPQLADARAAFALIRSRAAEWHVDPDRIGMIGFSAGAMLTISTALNAPDTKPAFIAEVYGSMAPVKVPADAPPLFFAIAADDPLFGKGSFGVIDSWRAAGRPVEFHLFEQGGHGFGMYQKTTTSTGWFDAYVRWLGMHGYLKPKG